MSFLRFLYNFFKELNVHLEKSRSKVLHGKLD